MWCVRSTRRHSRAVPPPRGARALLERGLEITGVDAIAYAQDTPTRARAGRDACPGHRAIQGESATTGGVVLRVARGSPMARSPAGARVRQPVTGLGNPGQRS